MKRAKVDPMERARAKDVAKRNAAHPDLAPVPMHDVACDGNAHRPEVEGMQDHCGVCMPRWGLISIPAVFPDLETYRRADDIVMQAARAHGAESEPEHEVGDLQQALINAYMLMTPEQRARWWEDTAHIREWLKP